MVLKPLSLTLGARINEHKSTSIFLAPKAHHLERRKKLKVDSLE